MSWIDIVQGDEVVGLLCYAGGGFQLHFDSVRSWSGGPDDEWAKLNVTQKLRIYEMVEAELFLAESTRMSLDPGSYVIKDPKRNWKPIGTITWIDESARWSIKFVTTPTTQVAVYAYPFERDHSKELQEESDRYQQRIARQKAKAEAIHQSLLNMITP